jgi:hypothetical protein
MGVSAWVGHHLRHEGVGCHATEADGGPLSCSSGLLRGGRSGSGRNGCLCVLYVLCVLCQDNGAGSQMSPSPQGGQREQAAITKL